MERQAVYAVIDKERDHQELLIEKGVYEKVVQPVAAEVLIISEYADKARKAFTENFGDEKALDVVRKIAALCVRTMEHHGVPERKQ